MKMKHILTLSLALAMISCQCTPSDPLKKPDKDKPSTEKPDIPEVGEASDFCYVKDGVLRGTDGKALALWGVNFQTPLSWEANRLNKVGVQKTAAGLNAVTDNNLDDVVLMGANHIRCHLTPADFTDAQGNLSETAYLDALDYLVAEAGKRGIHLSFAFINHMGQSGPGKDWVGKGAKTWIHDQDVVRCTQTYISQLLARKNKYNGVKYSENKDIVFWELINEPQMYAYSELADSGYKGVYDEWLKAKGLTDTAGNYKTYRKETVREYIDSMVELLRKCGDKHPVCWGLNWHRFRTDNADIFDGVAESKADVVAFCNYPGQDYVERDYSNYRYDFTERSFADWFNKYGKQENGYAWTHNTEFKGKAVVAYEFETFFNQSAYIYPIQAMFIKSMRGQCASMWTYTFNEIAQKFGGSHFLNLRCTPGKAASFMVAKKIMESHPYGEAITVADEMSGADFCISKSHNAAVYSDSEWYCTSGETASGWSGITPSKKVKHISGVGNSELVTYSGTGMYIIEQTSEGLEINLMPDVKVVGDQFIKSNFKDIITSLDDTHENSLSIDLTEWASANATLYRVNGKEKVSVMEINGTKGLKLKPGKYLIVKK